MLRIIEACERILIETIVLTFYSPPGIGKTSLGFSADSPLLLDADKGAHRSAFRKNCVRPETWDDIGGIEKSDVEGYKTLVLDTAGRTLDLLSQDIIKKNPKHGRGGSLTLQGFGELKGRFAAYLKLMRSFGLDIVLIAHSEEKQSGDTLIERLDMQGSSKQEVFKSSDAMARLGIVDGKRVLMFSPTETQFGKDPAGIGRIAVPDLAAKPNFLGGLITQIKDGLNAQSDEMAEESKRRGDWVKRVGKASTGSDYTNLIEDAWDNRSKRVLHDAAMSDDCTWDTKDACYRGAEPEPDEESETEPEATPEPESDPEPDESQQSDLPF